MALFILCSKFHLKSARNKDPWHWAFHGIVYCPIMYLDKQKGTLITLAEEVLNVPIWPEETGTAPPGCADWRERQVLLSCPLHTSFLQLHVPWPLVHHYRKTGEHKMWEVPKGCFKEFLIVPFPLHMGGVRASRSRHWASAQRAESQWYRAAGIDPPPVQVAGCPICSPKPSHIYATEASFPHPPSFLLFLHPDSLSTSEHALTKCGPIPQAAVPPTRQNKPWIQNSNSNSRV